MQQQQLFKTIKLPNGETIIFKAWGEVKRAKYVNILFNFAIAFGKAAEIEDASEAQLGDAFEKLEELIKVSIVHDGIQFNFDSLTFDDKISIAAELWEMNGLDGGGTKKVMSLYQNLMKKTVEAYLAERSKQT